MTSLTPDQWLRHLALQPEGELFAYAERNGSVALQRMGQEEPLAKLQPPGGRRAMYLSWQDHRTLLVTLQDPVETHLSAWRLTGPPYTWTQVLARGDVAVASPDGQSIAYLDRGEVWVADAEGRGARRLAGPDGNTQPVVPLCFSPEGRHLAFVRWDSVDEEHTLVVVLVAGGQE